MKRLLTTLCLAAAALCGAWSAAPGAAASPVYTAGIVMEQNTGRVLSGYNIRAKLPMASTTKVLTAITVIDGGDLDRTVAVPAAAYGVEGSSIYLQTGERLTVRQLLYGLMLQSGNDCAAALAITNAGSIEAFAEKMNRKAEEIGARESHFTNPHGLHDPDHYTTAYDLALITSYAMKNADFKEIVGTKKIRIPYAGHDYDRILLNKNKMLTMYEGATGVKTGFTKKAGRCLVSAATRRGVDLVCVVLNCGPMWERSMAMMDEAFASYVNVEVVRAGDEVGRVPVLGTEDVSVRAGVKEGFSYTVKKGTEDALRTEVVYTKKLAPPVRVDEEIGKYCVYYENQLIFSQKIYTMDSVEDESYGSYLRKVAERFNACGSTSISPSAAWQAAGAQRKPSGKKG